MAKGNSPWEDVNENLISTQIGMLESEDSNDKTVKDDNYSYAALLNAVSEGKLCYFEKEKCFLMFSPATGNWVKVSKLQMVVPVRDAIAKLDNNPQCKGIAQKTDTRRIKAIIEELMYIIIEDEKPAPKRGIIHTTNGFLEPTDANGSWQWNFIENKEGKDFNFRTAFRVEYLPEAQCPLWKAFLDESGLTIDDQTLLQNYIGQIILGLGNRSQRILFIDGASGTGKSIIGKIIVYIIGEESLVTLRKDNFGGRFDLARYANKLCVLGMDLPRDVLIKNGGALKSLTGGDLLQGAFHGCDREIGFEGNLSVILISNDRLQLKLGGPEDISAFKRRIASITFPRKENVQISRPELIDELRAEASGIFNWMLEGALRICESNGIISITEEQEQRGNAILAEAMTGARIVEAFVNDCVAEDEDKTITSSALLEEYLKYCNRKELQPLSERIAAQEILRAILKRFPLKHQRHDIQPNYDDTGIKTAQRGFKGLKIEQKQEEENKNED